MGKSFLQTLKTNNPHLLGQNSLITVQLKLFFFTTGYDLQRIIIYYNVARYIGMQMNL